MALGRAITSPTPLIDSGAIRPRRRTETPEGVRQRTDIDLQEAEARELAASYAARALDALGEVENRFKEVVGAIPNAEELSFEGSRVLPFLLPVLIRITDDIRRRVLPRR